MGFRGKKVQRKIAKKKRHHYTYWEQSLMLTGIGLNSSNVISINHIFKNIKYFKNPDMLLSP